MAENYIVHACNGMQIFTRAQVINSALEQETAGIAPRYAFRDYKTGGNLTPPGWLIWSTYADGCGVVFRRNDGEMAIITGTQGDFCIV